MPAFRHLVARAVPSWRHAAAAVFRESRSFSRQSALAREMDKGARRATPRGNGPQFILVLALAGDRHAYALDSHTRPRGCRFRALDRCAAARRARGRHPITVVLPAHDPLGRRQRARRLHGHPHRPRRQLHCGGFDAPVARKIAGGSGRPHRGRGHRAEARRKPRGSRRMARVLCTHPPGAT